MSPLELARKAGRLALEKKGFDVRILKLKEISSVCDYFLIVSGEADLHCVLHVHDRPAAPSRAPIGSTGARCPTRS